MPIAVLIFAWDASEHWLQLFGSHAQSASCQHQIPPNLDLRCFQRVEPLHFDLQIDAEVLKKLGLLVFGAYAVGFIPAAFTGFLIAQARLLAGNALSILHVLALGCLVGVILCAIVGANHYLHDAHFFEGCAYLVYFCAIATVLCWLQARRWWLEKDLFD